MRLLFSCFLIFSLNALAAERYTITLSGNEAGEMIVDRTAPDRVEVRYEFNDRGRGPEIDAVYQLDENRIPHTITISGLNYMKAPVDETFSMEDGRAVWKSSADSGAVAQQGFYASIDGPQVEGALLVRALLNAPDQRLAMVPFGEARLDVLAEHDFGGQKVQHVEVTGLGFEPIPLWVKPNGDLYAVVSGWFSLTADGAAPHVEEMNGAQDERRTARLKTLSETAIVNQSPAIAIINARIIDVRNARVFDETGVLIENGRISRLLPTDEALAGDVRQIDAGGKSLMPGLWDMHTHLDLGDGPMHLAAGVTTVRDLANDHEQIMDIERSFQSGEVAGPHFFRAGFIDGTGPFAGPTKARIETAEQAAEWIDFYADNGYHQIKIYSSIPVDLVPAMADRAHERGMRFSGHIPAGMWADQAVAAGFDEIQHVNMLFLNFYRDIVETRNPDRFIKPAERGGDLVIDSAPFQSFVQTLKETGTVVDPTVAVFMDLMTHVDGTVAPSLMTGIDRLPPTVIRGNLTGGLAAPEGFRKRYDESAQRMLDVVKALHDGGVTLVAGTDGMAGFTLQAELGYYAKAGIAPMDILKLATLGSAAVMGVDDVVGAIEPGMRADLILVDGRPDEQIEDIARVVGAMKEGVYYDPAVLYQGLSIKPIQ